MQSLGLKPKDYMGQNFLISEEVLNEIISAAEIKKSDTIIEIGPGLGVLTQELVKHAAKVIAIEKDKDLAKILNGAMSHPREGADLDPAANAGWEIINQDVLKFNFEKISAPYKIVANIPYYLTSHLLQILLTLKRKPEKIVLMVQKEVGERLVAEPGELSLLSISVQIFADVSVAAVVPKENFWPKPKVDSCVVVIEPKNKFPEIKDEKLFFRLVKIAFAGKRKQIHNTLQNGLKLAKPEIEALLSQAKVNPVSRPQELNIKQWIELYKALDARQDS